MEDIVKIFILSKLIDLQIQPNSNQNFSRLFPRNGQGDSKIRMKRQKN